MRTTDPTNVITLTDPAGVRTFRRVPDDVVRAVLGEEFWSESQKPRPGPPGTLTVTSIDRTAGTITFDRAPSRTVYSGPLGHLAPVRK